MSTPKAIVEYDDYPENPRDWDNLGTMICWHPRYTIGDKHNYQNPASLFFALISNKDWTAKVEELYQMYWEPEKEDVEYLRHQAEKSNIILNVYAYIHSDISLSTTPFYCPWDSGQVGYIFVPVDKVKSEWGWKHLTKKRREQIVSYLQSEVSILNEPCYIVTVENEEGEEIESCGGIYGEDGVKEFLSSYTEIEIEYK